MKTLGFTSSSLLRIVLALGLQREAIGANSAQRDLEQGIHVDFSVRSVVGESGGTSHGRSQFATLRITDAQSKRPIAAIKPKVWLSARRSEQVAIETGCEAKARAFSSGQITRRADVDLNGYTLVTLNQDKTVTFINPQLSWNRTKLESIVVLPANGLDWALTGDGRRLYVTMPEQSAVAVIDTATRKLIETVATGEGSRPTRIAIAPDQRSVWVGLDDSAKVAVFETAASPKVAWVDVGDGLHQLGFTPDGKFAFVTNTAADTLSILDVASRSKLADVPVGHTPLKAVWAERAQRIYVASVNDVQVRAIDPSTQKTVASFPIARGIMDIAVEPSGRFVFAASQLDAKVRVFDAADHVLIGEADVGAQPDQIAFTAGYAYVRSLASEKFSLIDLGQLQRLAAGATGEKAEYPARLSVTAIQAGQKPPAAVGKEVGVAAMLAALPEKDSMMIANAAEQTLYYYREGMMAPMGTLDNYKRTPRGLLLLDRSLRETAAGVFEAPVTVSKSGRYDVVVVIDPPRTIHCFTTELTGADEAEQATPRATLRVEPVSPRTNVLANVPTPVAIRIIDSSSGKPVLGVKDVRLLAFEPPGLWQQRLWMQQRDDGAYVADLAFPHSGRFTALVESRSGGLAFVDSPRWEISVEAPSTARAASARRSSQ